MKKTGLAVMLAAALLAGSLSVYADEIDTENPGMEETAEAQEAEPEEEPVPDTSNNVEEAGAAKEVTGEEESGEGGGGVPAEEVAVSETQEDQAQKEEVPAEPTDARTAPGNAEGITPADGAKTDDTAAEEEQKQEQDEEPEEKQEEDKEDETAGKAASELNRDSLPFNAGTEGQLGTKEHPYRYLVSENETVKVYKEFLLQLIGTAQQEGKEACWVSLEAHTGDDPQAEISVWNGEKNQFLADVYLLADPENADGYAWYTDTAAEELTLDLHAAEKALKYGETTVLADRSKEDAEEAVEEAPLLLRGGAGEGEDPETPEEPEPAVITLTAENCTVTPEYTSVNGDGKAKEPNVTVEYTAADAEGTETKTTLTRGTDYSVSYTDNIKPGTATITVTGISTEAGGYAGDITAQFTIQNVAVTGVKLNKTKVTLAGKGKTYTLTTTVSPSNATNKAVTWKSNRTGVVTVDQKGKITSKTTGGVATVTVTTKDGSKKAECVVTVEGFVKETVGGKTITRYYKNGGFLKGKQKLTIDGVAKYYYFDEKTGAMQTGMQDGSGVAGNKTADTQYQSAKPTSGHTYAILNAGNQQFALDVAGGSYQAKANVDIYRKNGTEAQAFTLTYDKANDAFKIQNYKGMVLDIAGASKSDRANLQTYASNNSLAQRFRFVENGDGSYRIENVNSGKVLDISGGKMQNKQNVQQYAWNKSAAQKWVLVDLSKYYFDTNGTMQTGTWKRFDAGSATALGDKQSSKLISGHAYTIVSAKDTRFALDVAGGSDKIKANVDIYRRNNTEAQAFFLNQVDGDWQIQNYKGMVLDIAGGSSSSGANLQTYKWNGSDAQRFKITSNGDGSYTITRKNASLALDIAGGRMENKTNVRQYTANGTAAQKWILLDVSSQYYFNPDGSMAIGWKKIDDKWRYFFLDGRMATGWQTISGKKYYFSADGVRATGFQTIQGKRYYFDNNGVMASGQTSISSDQYLFDSKTGEMITGWYFQSKTYYYDKKTGKKLKGRQKIDKTTYEFDSNSGALVRVISSDRDYGLPGYVIPYKEPIHDVRTIKNLIRTAMVPCGRTLWVWGGGHGSDCAQWGMPKNWENYFVGHATPGYESSDNINYWIGPDCSGYMEWVFENACYNYSSRPGVSRMAEYFASNFAGRGWGTLSTQSNHTYKPGDMVSMAYGHVWLSLGQYEDGSVILVHNSQKGVQISGTYGQAVRRADYYMAKYFPYWPYTPRTCEAYTVSASQKVSWIPGRFLTDPDGIQNMHPDEVLKLMLGD